MSDRLLKKMSRRLSKMYSRRGRPSIPPERLLKAMILMALYSIRSERQLCEELSYNFLYRWFLDMDPDESTFHHSAFCDNRERLLEHAAVREFFDAAIEEGQAAGLMSEEHFSVDGTLLDSWASMKSIGPKDDSDDDSDGNSWGGFKGKPRKNDTHASKTDPEARIMRKGRGKEAKLGYMGHALMENRNGLIRDLSLTQASGTCERDAALAMIDAQNLEGITLGADAAYNTESFGSACEKRKVEAHVADTKHYRPSEVFGDRYQASQKVRKRNEQIFGWMKTFAGLRKMRFLGRPKNEALFFITGAAYNILRICKLKLLAT